MPSHRKGPLTQQGIHTMRDEEEDPTYSTVFINRVVLNGHRIPFVL